MAKKGSMPTYETIDDYIAGQSEEVQAKLHELRSIILESAPEAKEGINYKVPTFYLVGGTNLKHQLMIAGYSKFVSFYPFPATMEAFADELKDYKTGKGSVQFPLNKPLPKDLISRMVKYRRDELLKEK